MTEDSSLTGLSVVPVSFSMAVAAAPQGTWLAQATTLTPALARSLKPVMPAGLPGGTTMVRVLVAKFLAVPVKEFGVGKFVHVPGIRRRENVRRRTLGDLGDEVRRTGEAEHDLRAGVVRLELSRPGR